ncbi:MAG TPA: protein kinase [Jatrophihabitans sp.]
MLGGRYRVLDRIGSGGMAEVFRAQDEVLDRPVAVKVFRAEHVAPGDTHGVQRQQLEMAALARLNHPNLIQLYDGAIGTGEGTAVADRQAYIVMELIEGPSLAARIAQGPLPEASAREIGIQLSDGLAYVHAQGMVHRDVKPENILLGIDRSDDDSTVRARLSDFGIVRLLGSEGLTSADFTIGTASYLAPEQARGSQVDPPADIYSLALVLLESLTGRKVFDGPPLEAALARLSQRPQIPAGLPEPWPGLLYAMTETDPRLRPSAAEVARALRNEGSRAMPLVPLAVPVAAGFADAPTGMLPAAAAATGPSGPLSGAAAGVAPRRKRRVPAAAIAAALSLVVILTALGIFLMTGNDAKSPAQPPVKRSPASAQLHSPTRSAKHKTSSAPLAAPTIRPHHSGSPTGSPTRSTPTSSAPTTSHPPSSSAPSTSHSTTAPASSTAPATSAPPTSRLTSPSAPTSTHTNTGSTTATQSATTSAAAAASSRAAGPTTAG